MMFKPRWRHHPHQRHQGDDVQRRLQGPGVRRVVRRHRRQRRKSRRRRRRPRQLKKKIKWRLGLLMELMISFLPTWTVDDKFDWKRCLPKAPKLFTWTWMTKNCQLGSIWRKHIARWLYLSRIKNDPYCFIKNKYWLVQYVSDYHQGPVSPSRTDEASLFSNIFRSIIIIEFLMIAKLA